jgi:ribosomal protein S21
LTKVTVREGESVERAIKRCKREHYLKPSVKSKLKQRAAEARARKREKRLAQAQGRL